jgi:hypothetical protein
MWPLIQSLVRTGRDIAPILVVIIFFQFVVLQHPGPAIGEQLFGVFLIVIGLTLFQLGLSTSLFPLGERLSERFAASGRLWLLLLFAFAIGFGSTVAEPALIAVTGQAAATLAESSSVDEGSASILLRIAASAAVGLSLIFSCVRIIMGWPAFWPILIVYGSIALIVVMQPSPLDGIAFDSGAAATSAINIPLIAALGIGLASVLEGRSPLVDGFGAVALASAMPTLIILVGYSFAP